MAFSSSLITKPLVARLRPIQPSDVDLLQAMYRRVSSNSLYYRFLRPYRPTPAEIEQLCRVPPAGGGTLVAVLAGVEEQIVGYAQYVVDRCQPLVAEPAFLVEDQFQGHGLGRMLFLQISHYALGQGVRRWRLHVEPNNRPMWQIIRTSGLRYASEYTAGTYEVSMPLDGWLLPGDFAPGSVSLN